MRRPFLALALCALSFVVVDQVVQHVLIRDGRLSGRRVAPFDPPFYTEQQEAWFEKLRSSVERGDPPAGWFELDPLLGWCPRPDRGGGDLFTTDRHGARTGYSPLSDILPAGVRRVVAVGCSFTRGDEVGDLDAWPALLDRDAPELEIANLAVGGYGLDQALLRLERDGLPLAPDEVWLGVLPAALPRTTNVYRPALRHWSSSPALKPRFEFDERGELRLVPLPAGDAAELLETLGNQSVFFDAVAKHDEWVRRTLPAWRPRGTHWTHYSGLARLALTWIDGGGRDPAEVVADPESEVFRVARALCARTREVAEASGARFRLVVLPGRDDLRAAKGEYWAAFVESLRSDGVEVIDLTAALRAVGVPDDDAAWMPGGHYSPATNALVARELALRLR